MPIAPEYFNNEIETHGYRVKGKSNADIVLAGGGTLPNNLIPYTGATHDVDLGVKKIKADKSQFNKGLWFRQSYEYGGTSVRLNAAAHSQWGEPIGAIVIQFPDVIARDSNVFIKVRKNGVYNFFEELELTTYEVNTWHAAFLRNYLGAPTINRVRRGSTPTGKGCIIINDIDFQWSFPKILISEIIGGTTNNITGEVSVTMVTDLTGFSLFDMPIYTMINADNAWHTGNFNPAQYVQQSALNTQLSGYATLAGTQTFTGTNTFSQSPVIPAGTLANHAVNYGQLSNYALASHVHTWTDIAGKPTFHLVATTGDYDDLVNLPSIPSLAGYATESWVNTRGYLTITTAIPIFVPINGAMTINGTKTFSESPVVPFPTILSHAANKEYVDNRIDGYEHFQSLTLSGNTGIDCYGKINHITVNCHADEPHLYINNYDSERTYWIYCTNDTVFHIHFGAQSYLINGMVWRFVINENGALYVSRHDGGLIGNV